MATRTNRADREEALFRLFSGAPPGRLFQYGTIERVCPDFRKLGRWEIYPVIQRLEREQQRSLMNVFGVGYRVMAASEHLKRGQQRMVRAARQVERGKHTVQHTRRDELDAEQLRNLDEMLLRLSAQGDLLRRQNRRIEKLEVLAQTQRQLTQADRRRTSADAAHLDERVARIERMMRRFGYEDPEEPETPESRALEDPNHPPATDGDEGPPERA